MSSCPGLKSGVSITWIGTATEIIEIDGVRLLTDPFFHPAESLVDYRGSYLQVHHDPALQLKDLPPIDAILLSHKDHWDNLDEVGRQLLDARHVFTTKDGAKNLAPRPGVRGMNLWETTEITLQGKVFRITATPREHVPGDKCIGFVLTTDSFGSAPDGRPNAFHFTGDTVYTGELVQVGTRFHVAAALMNLGEAMVRVEPAPVPKQNITMGGRRAARLFRDIKADWIIPMHYETWDYFTQYEDELRMDFKTEGVLDRVKWMKLGKAVKVLEAES